MANTVIKGHVGGSSFDIALTRYGSLENLHVLLSANPDMLASSGLLIEDNVDYIVGDAITPSVESSASIQQQVTQAQDTYAATPTQSAFDVALTQYGAVSGLGQLLKDNPNMIQRDGEVVGGVVKVKADYTANSIMVAHLSKIKPTSIGTPIGEIWQTPDEQDWVDSDSNQFTN